jgi:hypothetical protein
MTPNSPTSRSRLLRGSGAGGRRRTGLLGTAFALALAAAVLVFALPSSADDVGEQCTSNQQQGKLCLTVSDNPDPVAPSGLDGDSYLSYDATVTNRSKSNLSHVGLSEDLDDQTKLFRAPSTCSVSGQSVACTIGSLPAGASATVNVVVTAPSTEMLITNQVTATFDEDSNSGTSTAGKQATVGPYDVDTLVSQTASEKLIPQGESGQVNTEAGQPQAGKATINNPSTDVLASIDLLAPDGFCVKGTFKIGKKTYVCRNGGFVEASVVLADDQETHYNSNAANPPAPPLVFHLEWDESLTSPKQSKKNFVVFYVPDGSSTVQVISTPCNATASNLPCLRNISPHDGGWSVDLYRPDNGRMR